jgi:hypothetical protein
LNHPCLPIPFLIFPVSVCFLLFLFCFVFLHSASLLFLSSASCTLLFLTLLSTRFNVLKRLDEKESYIELYNIIKFSHRDGRVQVASGPPTHQIKKPPVQKNLLWESCQQGCPTPKKKQTEERQMRKKVLSTSWVRLEYVDLCFHNTITQALKRRTHRPLRWPIPANVKTHQSRLSG